MKPLRSPWTVFTDHARGRGKRSVWIEYMITATCAVGNMLFGYDQGVMGGFLTSAPFKRTFPEISNGNSTLQGFTVAVYELGCAAGALTVIIGGDKFGRRVTVMLGELIIILGAVLQASSFQLGQLIGGRVVTGFGNGMAAAVLPTWNGECAQPKSRGRAIMWQLTVNIFGIALAYWVGYGVNTSSVTGSTDWCWRFPLALQIVFAAATIVMALFLPDSPRALIKAGRIDEARDVVDMLSTIEDSQERLEFSNLQMSIIQTNLEEEAEIDSGWKQIFTQEKPRFFQRLVLAIMSMCMLQLSGINLITYYAPVIFEDTLGMSRNTSLLVSGFLGLEFWLATFIPIPLIDRLGRRPLMLFAAIGQAVCMAILAGCIAYPENKTAGYIATAFLFVFDTFFAIGFDGIPFLLPVELTPLQTRAKSVSIATGCFWLCNFFVVMISPILASNIGYGTYVLWCATNIVFIPVVYLMIPETLRATLEDIDELFETSTSWIIGPGSRKKIAGIIANREMVESSTEGKYDGGVAGSALAVEDV